MSTFVGTAKLEGREWVIDAPAHVLIRLRRLFQGTDRSTATIRIADTLESARDLEWVSERYPLEISPLDHLRSRAQRHRDAEAYAKRIMEAGYQPREFKLAVQPREYQRIAAELALSMRSLLLADELGLGKTASAICTFVEPTVRPVLVVTMTHLPRQWESEIAKFAPTLRVHRIREGDVYDIAEKASRRRGRKPTPPGRRQHLFDFSTGPSLPDVIVTSYSKLVKWSDVLAPIVKSVVFDECQELRRHETKKYESAKRIGDAVEMAIGLSATPFYNYGGELFNVMDVIAPGKLGLWKEFAATWCGDGNGDQDRTKAQIRDPKAFGLWAREQGLMLRRSRGDVGRELPALTRVRHLIDCDAKPLAEVEGRAMELARIITARSGTGLEKMEAANEISYLLRQATGIAKAPHVADFVELLLESEERVVVFAWHREVYSILMERLAKYSPVLYTGSESTPQKEKAKRAFVEGTSRVILISLRSGAGLDGLQYVCRTTVHAELDWSMAVHNQDDGRVHRDGQKEPVVAYYLVTDDGSDPVVADVLGVKAMQIEPLLDPDGEIGATQIDPEHVRKLAHRYLEAKGETVEMERAS